MGVRAAKALVEARKSLRFIAAFLFSEKL